METTDLAMMDQPDAMMIETTNTGSLIPLRPAASSARTKATCPTCGLVLLKKTLQRHMRTKHQTRSSKQLALAFRCLHCGDSFMRKDKLDRHVDTQHDNKDVLVECSTCGAQVRERSLPDHLKSQKCQNAQRQSQMRNDFGMWEAAAASLMDPRRFGPETVLHLLTVPWLVSEKHRFCHPQDYMNRFTMVEYLDLRGLAMRTIARALGGKDTNVLNSAVLALSLLATCDASRMLPEESYVPLFGIAFSLASQSSSSCLPKFVRVNGDHVCLLHETNVPLHGHKQEAILELHCTRGVWMVALNIPCKYDRVGWAVRVGDGLPTTPLTMSFEFRDRELDSE